MIIVGFGHRRFVGKDSAANFFITNVRLQKRNILTQKVGFATKMKAICHDLYSWAGMEDEDYYERHPELKEVVLPAIGKSPREVWIEFGTTVGRAIYSETWLMFVLHRKVDYLAIKDVRFPNEGDAILARGGHVFRVDNPRIPESNDVADSAMKDWNRWSGVILNDSDLATLNIRTLEAVKGII